VFIKKNIAKQSMDLMTEGWTYSISILKKRILSLLILAHRSMHMLEILENEVPEFLTLLKTNNNFRWLMTMRS